MLELQSSISDMIEIADNVRQSFLEKGWTEHLAQIEAAEVFNNLVRAAFAGATSQLAMPKTDGKEEMLEKLREMFDKSATRLMTLEGHVDYLRSCLNTLQSDFYAFETTVTSHT